MQPIQQAIRWAFLESALVLSFYAVLLPIRRLRGGAVRIPGSMPAADSPMGQYHISEWMGWSLIAVLPLAI